MILVDTSVWIDRLTNRITLQTLKFEELVRAERTLFAADLIMMEVLQGARDERHASGLSLRLGVFTPFTIVDRQVAVQAARNYRLLRARGITIRSAIDTLIATRCMLDDIPLLYSDRDFDPFVEHLGLISALDLDTGVD